MKTNTALKKVLFIILLLIALLFSNGNSSLFFAPWISTAMLLFVARRFTSIRGFLLSWLLLSIAFLFQFYQVLPLPAIIYVPTMLFYAFIGALPYLIDLVSSKKRNHFLHTFIFPIGLVLVEYIGNQFNPYGTWAHMAYTQESQLALVQSVSVFGLGYITFLIGWFASVVNWIIINEFQWSNIKKGISIYSAVILLTLFFGGFRLLFQKPDSETLRIASISTTEGLGIYDNNTFGMAVNNEKAVELAKTHFRERASKLNRNLFDRSIKEANAGAKIVFWSEGNGFALKEDESVLYNTASRLALENNIYLGVAATIVDPTNDKPFENKFVLFNTNGEKTIDYWKVIPVPGVEASMSTIKGSKIQNTKTVYGTVAAAICFDIDFPNYIKQAKGIDIFLDPSNDWKGIDPMHTNMARFRAIEQGFNLVRQTSNGLSVGADYTGRVISEMDYFTDKDKVLITQLSTQGITTIYSKIGDTFIGICLLLFIIVLVVLKKEVVNNTIHH